MASRDWSREPYKRAADAERGDDPTWQVVLAHLSRLIAAGVRPADVGVITPYNGQVALLRELRPASLAAVEINSVDGFQGAQCKGSYVRDTSAEQ